MGLLRTDTSSMDVLSPGTAFRLDIWSDSLQWTLLKADLYPIRQLPIISRSLGRTRTTGATSRSCAEALIRRLASRQGLDDVPGLG